MTAYVSQDYVEGVIDKKRRMLESVARILSKNYGVVIVFSPTGECSTNAERMILPYERNVDEALLLGMCGHETGHLRETDFDIRKEIANYPGIINRPLLFRIFNALEDVRIEIAMEEDYQGFKDLFRRMIPYIREEKGRLVRRTMLQNWMKSKQWSSSKIEELLDEYDQRATDAVEEACRQTGLSQQFIDREVAKLAEKLKNPIPTLMMILDVIYLRLRHYEDEWYPRAIREFVEDLDHITTGVYSCSNSHEVLTVAVEVYRIIEEAVKNPGSILNNKKGKKQTTSSEQEQKQGNGKGDRVDLGSGRILKVGCRVHHLYDPEKIGTIIQIDNEQQEIVVEWD